MTDLEWPLIWVSVAFLCSAVMWPIAWGVVETDRVEAAAPARTCLAEADRKAFQEVLVTCFSRTRPDEGNASPERARREQCQKIAERVCPISLGTSGASGAPGQLPDPR